MFKTLNGIHKETFNKSLFQEMKQGIELLKIQHDNVLEYCKSLEAQ